MQTFYRPSPKSRLLSGHQGKFKFTFRKSVLKVNDPPRMLSVERGELDLDTSLNLDLLFNDPPAGEYLEGDSDIQVLGAEKVTQIGLNLSDSTHIESDNLMDKKAKNRGSDMLGMGPNNDKPLSPEKSEYPPYENA